MTAFLHRNAFALCIIAALGLWLSAATRTSSFDDVPEIDRAEAQARIAAQRRFELDALLAG